MKSIPQRDLRNRSSEILRAVEEGEEFVVTVNGRPVAVIGPYRKRRWVSAQAVRELLATPTDESLLEQLRTFDVDGLRDPWADD